MFKCLKVIILLLILAALVFFVHPFLLDKAGRILYQKDELKPADVIVILAGDEKERVEYGVYLYRDDWAKKDRIIMSGGPLVWKYSWASLMKEHAEYLGIPGKNILLEDKSRNTEENAKYTKEIFQKRGYKSLILVTSPYHSKRAFTIFRKVMGNDIKIISAPVEKSWFTFEDWWKRRRDRSMVLNEYSKFLWLWIFGVK
ncbi:MAG: YdcF family protein [Nitrospirota bacterium]|nr:YdcF family protein [Nitrospirota bacterium]